MAINTVVAGDSTEATVMALKSEFLTIEPMDETCLQRYHDALKKALGKKGEVGINQDHSTVQACTLCQLLTINEINKVITEVNELERLSKH